MMVTSLEDRDAVATIINLHGHMVDEGQLDELEAVFTIDVEYDLTPMGGHVLRGLKTLKEASFQLGEDNPVAHHTTNIVIHLDSADEARARSKGLGITADGRCGSVTYEDHLVRTSKGWRIDRRRVFLRRVPLHP